MSTSPDAERLVKAHHALQRDLYLTDALPLRGGVAYFTADLTEPEWNHATPDSGLGVAGFRRLLAEIEAAFEAKGRAPAVELTGSGAGEETDAERVKILKDLGYSRAYRYAWLIPDDPRRDDDAGTPEASAQPGIEIRRVSSRRDAEDCFSVFRAVYGDDLEPGYGRALGSPGGRGQWCDVAHYLAYLRGRATAIGTVLFGRAGDAEGIAGLYNLAVHPEARHRGLGGLMTRHRLAETRRAGYRHVFLQTERTAVQAWQSRNGWQPAFFSEGFVLPRSSTHSSRKRP